MSKPQGTTRPAMKQAMKMFQPPAPPRADGRVIEQKPASAPSQLEGQRDIFDVLLEADLSELF